MAGEQRETIARKLKEELEAAGIETWMDTDLPAGANLIKRIEEALRKHETVVAIISEEYVTKEWPRREWDAAVAMGRETEERLIPVLVGITHREAAEHLPWLGRIKSLTWENDARGTAAEIARAMGRDGEANRTETGSTRRGRLRLGGMTTREAVEFTRRTLQHVAKVFEERLQELREVFEDIQGEVRPQGDDAMDVELWVNDERAAAVGIWAGGLDPIQSAGTSIFMRDGGVGNRSGWNGWIDLERNEKGKYTTNWKECMGGGWGGHENGGSKLQSEDESMNQAAGMLWRQFTGHSYELREAIKQIRPEWEGEESGPG